MGIKLIPNCLGICVHTLGGGRTKRNAHLFELFLLRTVWLFSKRRYTQFGYIIFLVPPGDICDALTVSRGAKILVKMKEVQHFFGGDYIFNRTANVLVLKCSWMLQPWLTARKFFVDVKLFSFWMHNWNYQECIFSHLTLTQNELKGTDVLWTDQWN